MLTPSEQERLRDEPVCLFSRDGRLLWRSPHWSSHGAREDRTLLGTKWQDFCYEIDAIRAWLASDTRRVIRCHFMLPGSGRFACVRYSKIALRGNWLCYGTIEVLEKIPRHVLALRNAEVIDRP